MKAFVATLFAAIAINCLAIDSDSVDRDIVSRLVNEGFLEARADTVPGAVETRIGPRYTLARIIIQDSASDTTNLASVPFTQTAVETEINRVLHDLESVGYYLASAVIEDITGIDSSLTIRLKVTRGPLVVASEYVFSGLEKTPAALVERYLPSIQDNPITPRLLDDIAARAERIPFLTSVSMPEVLPQEGYTAADIQLSFIERRQFHLEGIVGYVPSTSSGLRWSLDTRFQNVLGGGRDAFVRSERRESGRNLLDVGYSQPVFFAGIGRLGGQVSTRDYRDQFYEFALSVRYQLQLSPLFGASITAGWRNVEPNGNLPAYRAFSTGFGISASNRRNQYRELPYYSINWTISYSYRRYRDDSLSTTLQKTAVNETRTTLDLVATLPLYRGLAAHLSTSYWGYETAESLPPLSELYFLGGPGTIRGFRNEQFLAQRAAIAVVEPRISFPEGHVFAFVDGAYINVPVMNESSSVVTDESFEWGYGVGIDIRNARRAVNISLGWNRELAFDEPRLSVQFISDI